MKTVEQLVFRAETHDSRTTEFHTAVNGWWIVRATCRSDKTRNIGADTQLVAALTANRRGAVPRDLPFSHPLLLFSYFYLLLPYSNFLCVLQTHATSFECV